MILSKNVLKEQKCLISIQNKTKFSLVLSQLNGSIVTYFHEYGRSIVFTKRRVLTRQTNVAHSECVSVSPSSACMYLVFHWEIYFGISSHMLQYIYDALYLIHVHCIQQSKRRTNKRRKKMLQPFCIIETFSAPRVNGS